MQIQSVKISEIIPYEKNPRIISEDAVDKVAASIREFGFKNPVILDKDNIIVAGHTRLLAAKKLKMKEIPCIYADDLTPEQIKAFRLADNKVAEFSEWDFSLLDEELENLDFDMKEFGFSIEDELEGAKSLDDEKYTAKTDIPQYEIKGENPAIGELVDTGKTDQLIEEIEASDLPDDVKKFLKFGAQRHLVFNYSKIAEFYAHADAEVQELMEKSALVIIDFDDAMKYGYVQMSEAIREISGVGEDDE